VNWELNSQVTKKALLMKKALIVYDSRSGGTEQIAELIGEGLRMAGVEAVVAKAQKFKKESDLQGYDAFIVGSPNYHGEMLQSLKTFLFLMEKAEPQGRIGGAFGSYGWDSGVVERLYNTLQHVFSMDMASGPLMLKSASVSGGMQVAQAYGREIAEKLNAS
jgi:flavorubredoxin